MKRTKSAKKLLSVMLLLIMLMSLAPAAAADGTVWEDPVYTVTTIEGGEFQGMFALSVRRYEKGNRDNFVGGAAVSHGKITVTKEPSCSQYGEATVEGPIVFSSPCEFANSNGPVKAIIPTTSHKGRTERVKEPTYAEEGILALHCDVCGQTINYPIARLVPSAPYSIDTKVDVVCDYNKAHKMSLTVQCDRSGEVSLGADDLYHVSAFANDSQAYFEFEKQYPGHELSDEHSLAAQFHFDVTKDKWIQDSVPKVHVSCKKTSENTIINVINAPECPNPVPGEAVYNYTVSGTGYSISSKWFKMLSDTDITKKEPFTAAEFEPNTRYMLELSIKAEPGYLFPIKVEVNVENYGRLSFVEASETQLKSQLIFDTGDMPDKPQLQSINLLTCCFPKEPMLETADYMKVTKSSPYMAAASWEKDGSVVEGPLTAGESYIVHITFIPDTGYIFPECADIIVCGSNKITVASEENGTRIRYNIEYTVPKPDENAVATIARDGKLLSFASIDDAIAEAADGETINLLKDCMTSWTQGYYFDKSLSFQLDKHSLTFTQGFCVSGGKSLRFVGGNVNMPDISKGCNDFGSYEFPAGIVLNSNAKLLLEGTSYMLTCNSGDGIYGHSGCTVSLDGGSRLSINNCHGSGITKDDPSAAIVVKGGSTLNVSYCNKGITNTWNVDVLNNSALTVTNCTGNGSNGSHFNIVSSKANFSENGGFGMSAGNLSIDNGSLEANANGYNGVHVGGSLNVSNNSVMNIGSNKCTKISQWTLPAALSLKGSGTVTDSTINITGNLGSGIYQIGANNTLTMNDGTALTVTGNNAKLLGIGGGLVCEGNVKVPNSAVIANNHAPIAGDDIAIRSGAKLTLGPACKKYSLDGTPGTNDCHLNIDGWYKDGPPEVQPLSADEAPSYRWNPHSLEDFYVEAVEPGTLSGLMYLKAAHRQLKATNNDPAEISFKKLDSVSQAPIQGAVFGVFIDENCTHKLIEYTSDENGIFTIMAEDGTFFLKEIKAPAGYSISDEVGVICITELPAVETEFLDTKVTPNEVTKLKTINYKAAWNGSEVADGSSVILTNAPVAKRSIVVEKEWNDDGFTKYRSDSVSVKLLANEESVAEFELNKDNNWKHTVENMPVTDASGKEISYTLEEVTKLPHYIPSVEKTPTGLKLVNTLDRSDFTSISIEKRWIDETDPSHRPETVKVELLADGKTAASVELNEKNQWSAVVDNLPVKNDKGEMIKYSVKEITQSPYYTAEIEEIEPGFRIVNTLNPEAFRDITVSKVWNDKNDGRYRSSSVEIGLYADGRQIERIKLSKENEWKLTMHLPKYNNDGSEIKYSVEELTKLDRYAVSYRDGGFTVVNTLTDKPKTGDESRLGLYAALMCLSVLGAGTAITLGMKKKHKN